MSEFSKDYILKKLNFLEALQPLKRLIGNTLSSSAKNYPRNSFEVNDQKKDIVELEVLKNSNSDDKITKMFS